MYSQTITHLHRTAFIIALDCSSSMQGMTRLNNKEMRKADAVAIVCNYIVDELLARATRGGEVRDYYDIAIIGYNNHDVLPIIPENVNEFISIAALAKRAPQPREYRFEQSDDNGFSTIASFVLREWIKPIAEDLTPMHAALMHVQSLVSRWCSRLENMESFPPIVFNITDGECNDATSDELIAAARGITLTGTNDGNTLLINIHLSSSPDTISDIFPSDGDYHADTEYQMTLYRMSSLMPSTMEPLIEEIGTHRGKGPYRGMAYNITPSELLAILNIGSESINLA